MKYEEYRDLKTGEIRPERNSISTNPRILDARDYRLMPWYETDEEIEAGLVWGKEKAKLLKRTRARMAKRLTPVERRSIELYYFEDMNYREAGSAMGLNASSVYRAIQRALRKLRPKRMASPARRRRKKKASPTKKGMKKTTTRARSRRKEPVPE